MLKRQRTGVFANGGAFQNGIIDAYPYGAEFFEWNGNPSGYEGHLVYSWVWMQATCFVIPNNVLNCMAYCIERSILLRKSGRK